jgi:Sulfotransferase family
VFARRPLVTSGMHRSGTSLLSQVLSEAGVAMGVESVPEPVGEGERRRKNHYEDKRFVRFHTDLIRQADPSKRLLWEPVAPIIPTGGEIERARSLVEARSSESPWGWKDPRTVLFLDFWSDMLPEAVFLFVFRAPDEVVDSLRRRGDRELIRRLPGPLATFRYQRALRSWGLYNSRVLDFIAAHPTRSCLIDVDTLIADPERVFQLVRRRLGIPLRAVDLSRIYDPRRLRREPHARVRRVLGRDTEAGNVHERLTKTAMRHLSEVSEAGGAE